jgi:DNA-binding response OmpR family regulator
MSNRGYLLLVEDEPAVQTNNKMVLERRGYRLKQAFNLADARKIVADEMPGAIVLDLILPDGHGLDFLKELREFSNVPVLVLTAMGTNEDIIKGLEAGGDDYLTKPHELSVFIKRVEALLRRSSMVPDLVTLGPLSISISSNKAFCNDEDMVLSQKEYLALLQFMQYPNKMLTAKYLYEKVWGQELFADDSSLKAIISRLRMKLTDSGYTITASRGEGYYMELE